MITNIQTLIYICIVSSITLAAIWLPTGKTFSEINTGIVKQFSWSINKVKFGPEFINRYSAIYLYEGKSDTDLLQMISTGRDNETGESVFAEGWFASGRYAQGFFARGTMSQGVFSMGMFSQGLFAAGIIVQGIFSIGFLT